MITKCRNRIPGKRVLGSYIASQRQVVNAEGVEAYLEFYPDSRSYAVTYKKDQDEKSFCYKLSNYSDMKSREAAREILKSVREELEALVVTDEKIKEFLDNLLDGETVIVGHRVINRSLFRAVVEVQFEFQGWNTEQTYTIGDNDASVL